MSVLLDEKDLKKLIVIGDRVLIKPKVPQSKTKSGYVVKAGPGYPIPSVNESDEPWKNSSDEPKYVPLQAKEGDQAVYMQSSAIEIEFNREKYVIVPHSSLLLLLRDEGLFE
jgi:chaperonin GroES